MLKPTGFWSYTSSDDSRSRGRLSQLRALLADELQQHIGRTPQVHIFQDVAAIPPGSDWEKQIDQALRQSSFVIPIVTPALLQSEWCAREIATFRRREAALGRDDLVFPIHYVDTGGVDPDRLEECHDRSVYEFLHTRQWVDFTQLRHVDPNGEEVARTLERIATAICAALRRSAGLGGEMSEPARLAPAVAALPAAPPRWTEDTRPAAQTGGLRQARDASGAAAAVGAGADQAGSGATGGGTPPEGPGTARLSRRAVMAGGAGAAALASAAGGLVWATRARSPAEPAPPPVLAPRLVYTLTGHTASVVAVAFSADRRTLASGSWDGTVRLWDSVTGASLRTLSGDEASVEAVAFSPDGRVLASGGIRHAVELWDPESGEHLRRLNEDEVVKTVAFSPVGALLASGSNDRTVKVWDAANGLLQRTLTGHSDSVYSVAWSRKGSLLASTGADRTIRLWDMPAARSLRVMEGHTAYVCSVAFSSDESMLASGSGDSTVKLWNPSTGQALRTLSGHTNVVASVAFSPDGTLVGSASSDGTVKLWDAATGQVMCTLTGHKDQVVSVAFSPSGRAVAAGSYDNTVKLWSILA